MAIKAGDKFVQAFVISQKVYEGFLSLFGDRNILHVDGEYAKTKGFQGVVMHGNILNGFVSFFVGECLPIKNVILHGQEIRYLRPVYLGESLIFEAEVQNFSEAVGAYECSFTFRNAAGVKVAKGSVGFGLI